MDSSAVYCGVNPHRLATLTSSTTFPLYAASGAGCPSMEFNMKSYTFFPSAIAATAPISRHSSSFLTFPPSLCSTLFCAHRQSPLDARLAYPKILPRLLDYSQATKIGRLPPSRFKQAPRETVIEPAIGLL